jgi:hypothetical protein
MLFKLLANRDYLSSLSSPVIKSSSPVIKSENGQQAVRKSDIDAMTAINGTTAHATSDL